MGRGEPGHAGTGRRGQNRYSTSGALTACSTGLEDSPGREPGSAGLAQHVLESLQPDPSPYVRSLSPRRFLPRTWDWETARNQAEQVYQNYYSLPPRRGARDR